MNCEEKYDCQNQLRKKKYLSNLMDIHFISSYGMDVFSLVQKISLHILIVAKGLPSEQ